MKIFNNPIYFVNSILDSKTKNTIELNIISKELWLDLGCGTKPFENIFIKNNVNYFGIDIEDSGRSPELKNQDLTYDGFNIPFPDNHFDGILSTQVLEHVIDDIQIISEMYRVLKPNGKIIVSVPFCYAEHEKPYDFRRFTTFGLKKSFESAGFEDLNLEKAIGALQTISTLFSVYVYNNLTIPIPKIGGLISSFIYMPILVISNLFSRILPDNQDLFLAIILTGKKGKV
jgi:SAM-dependent methyltransferase